MRDEIYFIIKKIGFFAFSAILVAAFTSFLFIDIQFMHDFVKEASLTEVAQELTLAAIVMVHVWMMRHPALRASSLLVAGFFACMLIREMDFAFDEIFYGSWFWVALTVALACLLFTAFDTRRALTGLVGFFKHPSYGLICAGLLNVLVFSRLMGMGVLWRALLTDGYLREVKNAVEEGSELFGYSLCLLATISYARDKHKDNRSFTAAAEVVPAAKGFFKRE